MNIISANSHYFTIGICPIQKYDPARAFYVEKCPAKNPLRYIHKLHNLMFKSEGDAEKAIFKKLETEKGLYITEFPKVGPPVIKSGVRSKC